MSEAGTFEPTHAEVVRASARAWELDRYLAALLSPRDAKWDLITLAAFAGEIERIPVIVREPMMGEIRLQWWREALENTDLTTLSGHPVADAARNMVARHRLPLGLLIGIIDAQSVLLHEEPIMDDRALTAHLAKTEGALFELALRILGSRSETAHALAMPAGRAYGIARLLVELPALWAQGRVLIPETRLTAAGLSLADVQAGVPRERLEPVIDGLIEQARRDLDEARQRQGQLDRVQHAALLPLAVVEPYLRALRRKSRDPLREPLQLAPIRRVWALWWSHVSGRF